MTVQWGRRVHSHVSVCKVLEVVPPDSLVGVWSEHCPAITQAPQALYSHALPGVQQVSFEVLITQKEDEDMNKALRWLTLFNTVSSAQTAKL